MLSKASTKGCRHERRRRKKRSFQKSNCESGHKRASQSWMVPPPATTRQPTSANARAAGSAGTKGQLISKCLFNVFNSLKKRTKKFDFNFVPRFTVALLKKISSFSSPFHDDNLLCLLLKACASLPQVHLFSFAFWGNWRHQKYISKSTDL